MEKKDLIIGAFNNFDFEVLKPWIFSIKQTNFTGDIVLIAVGSDESTVREIVNQGVKVVNVPNDNNMRIHMLRFLYIFDYLKDKCDEYRYVISTDVRDVIFQTNPFEQLEEYVGPACFTKLVAQSEAMYIKDEPWNSDNILKNFGTYFYDCVKDNEIYNVGILAGRSNIIKDLCFSLFQMSLNRPDWVADQAAYNMLLSFKPWSDITYKAKLKDGWAINAHVTNKPDLIEKYGPLLIESRPVLDKSDGFVKNSDSKIFPIVHQYDRDPDWMQFFMKKYNFTINQTTNTGTAPKYFVYKT
jgi:hypothetical protein